VKRTATPAPWRICGASCIEGVSGEPVAICVGKASRHNARLIAKAPELYEALALALRLLESDGGKHHVWRRLLNEAMEEAPANG
jgi:hypothetical protein